MRVLVYPHELIIGGSPINAIDLASAVSEHGCEAMVYGIQGPLKDYIAEKGLRFVPAHPLKYRPGPTRIVQLAKLARHEKIDLIHAYEWPPCLDAYYGAHLMGGVPVVCTVLSMSLVPLIPDSVPLIVGTRQLLEEARRSRAKKVDLLEPPIDTDRDHPRVDGAGFRRQHGISPDELLVVVVSRLAIDLKLDALCDAIDAVAQLAGAWSVRLVVVGTGEALGQLSHRAERANAQLGRKAIILAGPALDPRPAYAAADIVLGMGSSALRAMAFAKPVVVQGESGYSMTLDPVSWERFAWQGFYGVGNGQPGRDQLAAQIASLLTDAERRRALGAFGRRLVTERFSLRSAAAALTGIYERTLCERNRRGLQLVEAARVGWRAMGNEARMHLPSDKRARRAYERAKLAAAAAR